MCNGALNHRIERVGIFFVAVTAVEPRDQRLACLRKRFVLLEFLGYDVGLVVAVVNDRRRR